MATPEDRANDAQGEAPVSSRTARERVGADDGLPRDPTWKRLFPHLPRIVVIVAAVLTPLVLWQDHRMTERTRAIEEATRAHRAAADALAEIPMDEWPDDWHADLSALDRRRVAALNARVRSARGDPLLYLAAFGICQLVVHLLVGAVGGTRRGGLLHIVPPALLLTGLGALPALGVYLGPFEAHDLAIWGYSTGWLVVAVLLHPMLPIAHDTRVGLLGALRTTLRDLVRHRARVLKDLVAASAIFALIRGVFTVDATGIAASSEPGVGTVAIGNAFVVAMFHTLLIVEAEGRARMGPRRAAMGEAFR